MISLSVDACGCIYDVHVDALMHKHAALLRKAAAEVKNHGHDMFKALTYKCNAQCDAHQPIRQITWVKGATWDWDPLLPDASTDLILATLCCKLLRVSLLPVQTWCSLSLNLKVFRGLQTADLRWQACYGYRDAPAV